MTIITKYFYISFILVESTTKTNIYKCCNNKTGDTLGHVKWHGPWRQYCFMPYVASVYSSGCLKDIREFIGGLMETRALNRIRDKQNKLTERGL